MRANPRPVAETLRDLNPPDRFRGRVALLHRDGSRVTAGLLAHRVTAPATHGEGHRMARGLPAAPAGAAPGGRGVAEALLRPGAVHDGGVRHRSCGCAGRTRTWNGCWASPRRRSAGLRVPEIAPGPEAEETERADAPGAGDRRGAAHRAVPADARPRPPSRLVDLAGPAAGRRRPGGGRDAVRARPDPAAHHPAAAAAAQRGQRPDRHHPGHRPHRAGAGRRGRPASWPTSSPSTCCPRCTAASEPPPGPLTGHVMLRRVAARSVLDGHPGGRGRGGEGGRLPGRSPRRPSAWRRARAV